MNARPNVATVTSDRPRPERQPQEITWVEIRLRAPQMAATMTGFLDQLAVSARPATVAAYSMALRFFAGRVTDNDPACVTVGQIERRHIEDYKRWLAARPGMKAPTARPR